MASGGSSTGSKPLLRQNDLTVRSGVPTKRPLFFNLTMGKQYNKTEKLRRRQAYAKRKKAEAKAARTTSKAKPKKAPAKKKEAPAAAAAAE